MKTAIVILNYNDGSRTASLASKISDYKILDHIIIVDNCSTDDSLNVLQKTAGPHITVLSSPENGGYARGNNTGICYAIGKLGCDYIFIANPDVYFTEDTASKMLDALKSDTRFGAAAPLVSSGCNVWKLPGFCGIIESLFLVWFTLDKRAVRRQIINSGKIICDAGVIEGSFFLISSAAYNAAGGLDERTFLYGEEIILAHRLLEHGFRECVLTDCYYDHLHSASIRKNYRSSKARAFHHFRSSFRIYNKYYLHTTIIENIIFETAYCLGYIERLIYDIFHSMPWHFSRKDRL